MERLSRDKHVRGQGIETDERAIYECVAKGFSVFHDELEKGLAEYADKTFDYVILSGSFPKVKSPDSLIANALRVGRKVVAGFPNFSHYTVRFQVFFLGMTPVTSSLPYQWYDTPNMHFLGVSDFRHYCRKKRITIEKTEYFGSRGRVYLFPNLFAEKALFLINAGSHTPVSSEQSHIMKRA